MNNKDSLGSRTQALAPQSNNYPSILEGEGPRETLSKWRENITIQPVYPDVEAHTLLCYYTECPESPDGRWVLLFLSRDSDGHLGDVCILERETGELSTLATGVTVEDAHRQAYQQWVCGGKGIVYQDLREDGQWQIVYIDLDSRESRVLTKGNRQIYHGQPHAELVPLHGLHWDPGSHRGLELLNVRTGEIRAAVTVDEVRQAYPEWVAKTYKDQDSVISLYAAKLSPDMNRVMFKLSSPTGQGGFRHPKASLRLGLFVYELQSQKFLCQRDDWGHPAWHPDSRTIINVPNVLINSDTGDEQVIEALPKFPGSHPSFSPDGDLFVTDTRLTPFGGPDGHWGVVVAATDGSDYHFVHRFDFTGGAQSWRPPHPHPTFSADGKRVYYNVASGQWTTLYVAQRGD